MLLRAEYVALAMKMQEMADGTVDVSERGARHSRLDMSKIQAVHDHSCELGANCSMAESASGAVAGTRGYKPSSTAGNGSTSVSLESGNPAKVPSDDGAEVISRETLTDSTLKLVESAATLEAIVLKEARADYEIKLISPGKGSTAFYPAEVLKRDGPKVFTKETHIYLNHATQAEESQRPEGDVKNLAGVLTSNAVYHESHVKGPGLYARMKVFADHGQLVEEKAAHVGMSIRASGIREAGQMRDGVPILKQLLAAESVDIVTKAGRGGMILTESAKVQNPAQIQTQEAAMDAAEINKLVEAGVKAGTSSLVTAQTALLERAIRGDAREEATRILKAVTLPELGKERVIEAALRSIPKTEAGELDRVKFTESVNLEAKREGAYIAELTQAGRVVGMGATVVTPTPEQAQQHRESAVATRKDAVNVFESIMGGGAAAKAAASHYGEEAA